MVFNALLATKSGETVSTDVVALNYRDLMAGNVTVAVDYSTVNDKDVGHRRSFRCNSTFTANSGYQPAVLPTASTFLGRFCPSSCATSRWEGVDSVHAPQEVRIKAWSRLALDLDLDKLVGRSSSSHLAIFREL